MTNHNIKSLSSYIYHNNGKFNKSDSKHDYNNKLIPAKYSYSSIILKLNKITSWEQKHKTVEQSKWNKNSTKQTTTSEEVHWTVDF